MLNLAGIPGLRSSDLNGLVPENDVEPVSPLRTLILNKTNIDDNASPWISACLSLETLEVAETKISRMFSLRLRPEYTRISNAIS